MIHRNSLTQESTSPLTLEKIIGYIGLAISYISYIPYLVLYIVYIVPIIREKSINYLTTIILQLLVACTINTFSYSLPSYKDNFQTGSAWCNLFAKNLLNDD